MTPREGGTAAAGRTKQNYNYTIQCLYYCGTQETPRASEDTQGDRERHQRDWRAHEGSKTPEGPEGGIGAGRRARGTQHPSGYFKQLPDQGSGFRSETAVT